MVPHMHLVRRSTSEVSKGNVLGYYRNLGFLRYGNKYCVPCRPMALYDSVVASVDVNLRILWRIGRLYSQMAPPILAGFVAICSCSTAAEPLVRLCSTARTNGRAVTLRYWKKGFSYRQKRSVPHMHLVRCSINFRISGNRGYDSSK